MVEVTEKARGIIKETFEEQKIDSAVRIYFGEGG